MGLTIYQIDDLHWNVQSKTFMLLNTLVSHSQGYSRPWTDLYHLLWTCLKLRRHKVQPAINSWSSYILYFNQFLLYLLTTILIIKIPHQKAELTFRYIKASYWLKVHETILHNRTKPAHDIFMPNPYCYINVANEEIRSWETVQ